MFSVYELFNRINEISPEIRLDAGQPDIPVSEEIIDATVVSLLRGETGYANSIGISELREAIADAESVSPDEVVVAPGAKLLIAAEIAAAKNVAVIAPYWNAYILMARQFGKEVEVIETSFKNRWTPEVEDIDAELLILNYPNNPTGRVLSPSELRPLLEIAEYRGIRVLSDEIYGELSFREFTPVREMHGDTVAVKGFSKLFSMTGFRLGYAIAHRDEILRIQRFIESTVTSTPIFVQRAGIRAIQLREKIAAKVREVYQRRVALASRMLRGLEFHEPEGSFYIFLRVPLDGMRFAERLLQRGVAVFPGIAFGNYRNFVRLSLTDANLERGLRIIREEAECVSE